MSLYLLLLERLRDFYLRGRWIFLERLRNFLTHSQACLIFLWIGCLIFLWRLNDFFVERLRDFFGGCMIFCVVRLRDFFFVWRGCISFCEETLCDVCGWRGSVIFLTHKVA